MGFSFLQASAVVALAALSLPAQKPDSESAATAGRPGSTYELRLKYGAFDPTVGQPALPAALTAGADVGLFVVQFHGAPTDVDRAAVTSTGAEIHGYLPHDAYVVRMASATSRAVDGLARTRWVGAYQPAWRLEPALLAEHVSGVEVPERDYNVVVVDKRRDKPGLAASITALGGAVVDAQEDGLLMTVRLTGAQLVRAARLDEVLWIDRWTAPELDMDNARIQGGADYVEGQLGYTGQGVRGHVYEGVEANHQDFSTPFTNVASGGSAQTHGHCTAGIVFGNGTSHPSARGMAPDAVGLYTTYTSAAGSRNSVIGQVVNTHQGMFTTASWGDARTRAYTSVSADSDDVIFDHRIPWTQSQSNAGNQDSRPQAWAKNIFSIGGVAHRNNSNPADDSWASGGGSTGPAADGRIKPDLCAYYDDIACSDRTGGSGYSSGNWYSSFGGTSGATPIVAGHNAIAIQMFTDGLFRNPLRVPGGTRFQNRPFAQTLKALMIASAQQYSFSAGSTDNRREHCGWGFPSLRNLFDNQNRMFVVAEDDIVRHGDLRTHTVAVSRGEAELKVCMTFMDPAGNPAASQASINDLTLKVTSPSGLVYWGNVGLSQGNYSTSGGAANTVDTVECVYVQNPEVGNWAIEVIATSVVQDAHVATAGVVDASYALCAVGVNASGVLPRFSNYGTGCGPQGNNLIGSTFYEQFGAFDLGGGLRFTQQGNQWFVAPCPGCFDTGYTNGLGLGDDQLSLNHGLGFAFPLMGGGTTSAIDIDSNGWIGLIAGQHPGSDYTESVAEFVSGPARIAGWWDDLNPASGGDVYFDTAPGRATITWAGVPEYPSTGSNTFQIQLFSNGDVVLAYQAITSADSIVGYSQGGVADPGATDLTNPGAQPPLSIGISAPPRINTTVSLTVDGLPASATAAFVNLGLTQQSLDLTSIGMPGCLLLTSLDQTLAASVTGSSASASLAIPNITAVLGARLHAQGIVLDAPSNQLGALTSDGGTMTLGN